MIPLIERELVTNKRWLTESDFVDVMAVVQTAPGAVAINAAIFLGYKAAGLPGAVSACLGIVLPSFLVILGIATVFARLKDLPAVKAAFMGIRPAVAALIVLAVFSVGKNSIKDRWTLAIAAAAAFAVIFIGVSPILVLLASGAAGYVIYGAMRVPRPGENGGRPGPKAAGGER